MSNMTYIWNNPARREFVEKYFDYAKEHLNEFLVADKIGAFEAACRAMDYCLLCSTTIVQNLMNALPKSVLKTPRVTDCVPAPEFQAIVWSWEARNTLAHRYTGFRVNEAELDVGGASLSMNGNSLYVNGFFIKPVSNVCREKSTLISCPANLSAYEVLNITVSFWWSAYEDILRLESHDTTLQYDNLWKSYKDKNTLN